MKVKFLLVSNLIQCNWLELGMQTNPPPSNVLRTSRKYHYFWHRLFSIQFQKKKVFHCKVYLKNTSILINIFLIRNVWFFFLETRIMAFLWSILVNQFFSLSRLYIWITLALPFTSQLFPLEKKGGSKCIRLKTKEGEVKLKTSRIGIIMNSCS